MNEERMLKPAVIGGVLLGILSSLPIINLFNCFCCAWVIGGGVLAAYLYVKESPVPATLGRGVALGLLTGLIGGIVTALFSIPWQALEQVPNSPPETLDRLRALSQRGSFDIFFLAIGFVFVVVTYSIVAMLGGAIGVAIFEKRKPAAGPPDIPTYQPPQNPPPDAP
jgi:hypothetical protein